MFDENNKQQNLEGTQPEPAMAGQQEAGVPQQESVATGQQETAAPQPEPVMAGQQEAAAPQQEPAMAGQQETAAPQQPQTQENGQAAWNGSGRVMGDSRSKGAYGQGEYRYGREHYQNQPQAGQTMYGQGQSYTGQNMSQQGRSYSDQNMSQPNQSFTRPNMPQNNQSYSSRDMSQQKRPETGKSPWVTVGKVAACIVLVAVVGAASAIGTVKLINQGRIELNSGNSGTEIASTSANRDNKNKKTEGSSTVSTVSANTAVVTDVSEMVSNTMPSVVSITNVGTVSYSGFFGSMGTYEAESNGSGIIIGQTEDELLVVTNQHVVAGANTLKVIFIDEESCEANVKGTDAEKDLAVIAVPISSLKEETLNKIKVATLGDSDALNVGEPAIAIGNALGYGQSVTLGVISAKDREVTTENSTNKLIQTDAAINPGNSGGALLNIAGEVIGINSVKYSSTEVEGMGYAIPISDATPIINELMNKETKTKVDDENRAYLGVSGVDITSDVAKSYNMPKGVYVTQVVKNSPAEKAGIKKGDIITKIADVSVTSFDELKAELEYHAAGSKIMVELQAQAQGAYGYESKQIEVTLDRKED